MLISNTAPVAAPPSTTPRIRNTVPLPMVAEIAIQRRTRPTPLHKVVKRRKVEKGTLNTSSSRPLGARSPTASGARPPSALGARSPSASGARPPSVGAKSPASPGARPPSVGAKSPASPGARPPSALSARSPSASGARTTSSGARSPSSTGTCSPTIAGTCSPITVSDGSLSPIGADSPVVSGRWPPFSGPSKENARSDAQSTSDSHAERNQRSKDRFQALFGASPPKLIAGHSGSETKKDRPISLPQLERILASPAKTWKLPPLISPIKISPIKEYSKRRTCGTQTSPIPFPGLKRTADASIQTKRRGGRHKPMCNNNNNHYACNRNLRY